MGISEKWQVVWDTSAPFWTGVGRVGIEDEGFWAEGFKAGESEQVKALKMDKGLFSFM